MEFIFKKTTELTDAELDMISVLFERVFKKPRPVEILRNQYLPNPLGYSYHSMIVENGEIVGLNSYVPAYYSVNGRKTLFANSTDSMVDKPYRDFFNYRSMVELAYDKMREEGIAFVYGYPNDNAYPVVIKSRLMKHIGNMHIYALPIHIGCISGKLAFLNPLSELFCRIFIGISGWFASGATAKFAIEKDAESYNATRYRRGDGKYSTAGIAGANVYYKIKEHEGIRTAFIIDIDRKSPETFVAAVKYIVGKHRKEFDMLLYPGYLLFANTGMIRIPRKFEPKKFNFTGKALDRKAIPDTIWDIRNWDTNLSNYDLI